MQRADVGKPSVVVATRSTGKLRELASLCAAAGLNAVDLDEAGVKPGADEDAIEVHASFAENALAKARYFFARTGRPVIADDSGLVVRALGGAPGVRSKRWSGDDTLRAVELDWANNRNLLESLKSAQDRAASFVCAAAYVDRDHEIVEMGEVTGEILREPMGSGGFGYDSVFYSPELGCTFAEAGEAAKARVSHRARAFDRLFARLFADVDFPRGADTIPSPRGA
jgi:XTP/dITP diphosphohydrolase